MKCTHSRSIRTEITKKIHLKTIYKISIFNLCVIPVFFVYVYVLAS